MAAPHRRGERHETSKRREVEQRLLRELRSRADAQRAHVSRLRKQASRSEDATLLSVENPHVGATAPGRARQEGLVGPKGTVMNIAAASGPNETRAATTTPVSNAHQARFEGVRELMKPLTRLNLAAPSSYYAGWTSVLERRRPRSPMYPGGRANVWTCARCSGPSTGGDRWQRRTRRRRAGYDRR